MKLPILKKSNKEIVIKVEGYNIKFRSMRLGQLFELRSNPKFKKLKDVERMVYFLAYCLVDYSENTIDEKIEFIKSIDFSDIDEIINLTNELGMNVKKN